MRFLGSLPRQRWLIGGALTAAVIAAIALAGLASTQTLSRHAHASGALSFASPVPYLVNTRPAQIAVGDVDHDGRPDLVTASGTSYWCDSGGSCHSLPAAINVLLNDGKGNFHLAPGSPIVITCNPSLVPPSIAGVPSPRSGLPCNNPFYNSVVLGDFNGDGKLDIAVLDANDTRAYVLPGNGDGTFQMPTTAMTIMFPYEVVPIALAESDVNHDGKLDLAVAGSGAYTPGLVSILQGHGDGTFDPPLPPGPGSNSYLVGSTAEPFSIVVGDFNGDGNPDVVTVNANTYGIGINPRLGVHIRPFSAGVTYSYSVLLGNGAGKLTLVGGDQVDDPDILAAVALGDFNGDGKVDLAFANDHYTNPVALSVSMMLGRGDGTFTPAASGPIDLGSAEPTAIATGDFNGDGLPDLAVTTYDGHMEVLLNKGGAAFQPPVSFAAVADNGSGSAALAPSFAAVADFNDDGLPDLAIASSNPFGGGYLTAGNVSLLLNTSTFTLPTKATLGASKTTAVQGDTVTFTSTVTPTTAPTGTPGGSVTFKDGGATLATVNLSGGKASYSTTSLALGNHTITAVYSGNSRFQSSTSAAVTVTIGVNGEDVAGSPAGGNPPSSPATGSTTGTTSGQQASMAQPNAASAPASSQHYTATPRATGSPLGVSLWLGLALLLVGLGGIGGLLYRARRVARS